MFENEQLIHEKHELWFPRKFPRLAKKRYLVISTFCELQNWQKFCRIQSWQNFAKKYICKILRNQRNFDFMNQKLFGGTPMRQQDLDFSGRGGAPSLMHNLLLLFYFLLGLRGGPELVGRVGQVDHTHMHGLVLLELWRHWEELVAHPVPGPRYKLVVNIRDVEEDVLVRVLDSVVVGLPFLLLLLLYCLISTGIRPDESMASGPAEVDDGPGVLETLDSPEAGNAANMP